MALKIIPYTKEWEPGVCALNARLKAARAGVRFPETFESCKLPEREDRKTYQSFFIAVEDDNVRGAYILKHQEFWIRGEAVSIAGYQLPLSEGIIDKTYNLLGVRLLADASRRQPSLYALGMGGTYRPLPRLLARLRWPMELVPFFFKIVRPGNFFRNITYLRTTRTRRWVLDFVGASGIGWLAARLLQWRTPLSRRKWRALDVEVIADFCGNWVDELWYQVRDEYSMVAVRDTETLNLLYPPNSKRFIRLKVSDRGRVLGWALLIDTSMTGHKQFGNARLGTLVDCLAKSSDAQAVVAASVRHLEERGVDLIASNQSDVRWCEALKLAGCIRGPSNFALALSKPLAARLDPVSEHRAHIHMNRGDGDGPIHL